MSAPQTIERIKQHLVKLKFVSALEVVDQTVQRLEKNEITALEALDELLEQEHGFRETRRVRTQLPTSRLLQHKTLDSFDFAFQPSLDRQRRAVSATCSDSVWRHY